MSGEQQPVAILSWEQADQIMQDQRAEIARLRAELSGARHRGETGQPALTDAERDDMACAASRLESDPNGPRDLQVAATLRGVLERMGGGHERVQMRPANPAGR